MSTRSKAAVILASAGVLIAGWQIGTANGQTVDSASSTTTDTSNDTTGSTGSTSSGSSSSTQTGSSSGSSSTSSGTSTAGSSSSSSSSGSSSGVSGTFTGDTATNQYGEYTVTVTLANGVITDVQAQTSVYEQHSQRYVQTAVPILRQEVIAANSADVNLVSGATFTSESYLSSLQSALDKAGR